mgnify:CR=1 FL=1
MESEDIQKFIEESLKDRDFLPRQTLNTVHFNEFIKQFFQKRVFHAHPGVEITRDLFSLSRVFATLAKSSSKVKTRFYKTCGDLVEKPENPETFFKQEMGSIVFNNLQSEERACAELADWFGGVFSCNVDVACFVTPRGGQTTKRHYDPHDVFVFQIEGEKRWKIWRPINPNAIFKQPHKQVDGVDHKLVYEQEVVLKPGDMFYVPRGWVHEVSSRGMSGHSIHASFVLEYDSWFDVFSNLTQEALRRMRSREQWRNFVPINKSNNRESRFFFLSMAEELTNNLKDLAINSDIASYRDFYPALPQVAERTEAARRSYVEHGPLTTGSLLEFSDVPYRIRTTPEFRTVVVQTDNNKMVGVPEEFFRLVIEKKQLRLCDLDIDSLFEGFDLKTVLYGLISELGILRVVSK